MACACAKQWLAHVQNTSPPLPPGLHLPNQLPYQLGSNLPNPKLGYLLTWILKTLKLLKCPNKLSPLVGTQARPPRWSIWDLDPNWWGRGASVQLTLTTLKVRKLRKFRVKIFFWKAIYLFISESWKKNNEMHGQQKNNLGNGNVYLVLLVWTSSIIYSLHQVVSPSRFLLLCAWQLIEKTLLLLRDKPLLCRMRILSWSTTLKQLRNFSIGFYLCEWLCEKQKVI